MSNKSINEQQTACYISCASYSNSHLNPTYASYDVICLPLSCASLTNDSNIAGHFGNIKVYTAVRMPSIARSFENWAPFIFDILYVIIFSNNHDMKLTTVVPWFTSII